MSRGVAAHYDGSTGFVQDIRPLKPQTLVRLICVRCLHGRVQSGSCQRCGGETRALVQPVRAGEFAAMDDERRMDLRTRRAV